MSVNDLKLLPGDVLIRPISEEKQGGIMIPSSAEKKPTKGEVVATGGDSLNSNGVKVPLTVKVGNKVFYRQWAGQEVEHKGEKFIAMKESDIVAIIIEQN